jgi:hypothetical protein
MRTCPYCPHSSIPSPLTAHRSPLTALTYLSPPRAPLITAAGLGEEHSAKLKLRLGLNLRTQRAYAKLRFRTEPVSPFDIGDGLSCAGKVG